MAKKITITYQDKTYTLEYTRNSVRQMERSGFVLEELDRKPMTMIPAMFAGAFLAHHPFVKQDKIEEIYGQLKNKAKLLETLTEMFGEPYETLIDDSNEGNADWVSST